MIVEKVLVVGAGNMGQQIGFQAAIQGFETVIFNPRQASLDTCRDAHVEFAAQFRQRGVPAEQVVAALARIDYRTDLAAACEEVDLVSESIIEDLGAKREIYSRLDALCPSHTIFTTNSSTFLPSQMADASGRPDRFMAMHFVLGLWDHKVVELMAPGETSAETFDAVYAFSEALGMVPVNVHREQPGYIINSLLIPWAAAAQSLVTNSIASPEDIDRTWMISTRMDMGPFGFMDAVGMGTVHTILNELAESSGDVQHRKNADYLYERFIARGRLGIKTGEGYYRYPDPAYRDPDFIR